MRKIFSSTTTLFLLLLSAVLMLSSQTTVHATATMDASISTKQNLKSAKTLKNSDFEYVILKNGTIEITKYIGSGTKVMVPQKIDKKR